MLVYGTKMAPTLQVTEITVLLAVCSPYEQVPGIRYQLASWTGPVRFWVRLGHDACVLDTRPPERLQSDLTSKQSRGDYSQASQGETLTFLSRT